MKRSFANHYFVDDLKNTNKSQIEGNVRLSIEKQSSRFEQNCSYSSIKFYLLGAWKFGIRESEEL
jgi:hypothetical protein